jgi:hypothetical protein
MIKPCIIRWHNHRWEVYNESGIFVLARPTYVQAANAAEGHSFSVVPPSTGYYRSIVDRLQARFPSSVGLQ